VCQHRLTDLDALIQHPGTYLHQILINCAQIEASLPYVQIAEKLKTGTMKADTNTIAQNLINDIGLEGAIKSMGARKTEAHQQRDNYQLSIWREVGHILTTQQKAD